MSDFVYLLGLMVFIGVLAGIAYYFMEKAK